MDDLTTDPQKEFHGGIYDKKKQLNISIGSCYSTHENEIYSFKLILSNYALSEFRHVSIFAFCISNRVGICFPFKMQWRQGLGQKLTNDDNGGWKTVNVHIFR